jgi:hypothetical protein
VQTDYFLEDSIEERELVVQLVEGRVSRCGYFISEALL